MIRPKVTISRSSVEQVGAAVYAQANRQARILAEADGRAMVAAVEDIVAAELPDRSGVRHKANTTHLSKSFTYKVTRDTFPITVELTIKPGVNARKIAALEYGNPTHTIEARNTTYLRWGSAQGDIYTPRLSKVEWKPGPKSGAGYHFMERARDAVAARRSRTR